MLHLEMMRFRKYASISYRERKKDQTAGYLSLTQRADRLCSKVIKSAHLISFLPAENETADSPAPKKSGLGTFTLILLPVSYK